MQLEHYGAASVLQCLYWQSALAIGVALASSWRAAFLQAQWTKLFFKPAAAGKPGICSHWQPA